MASYFCVEVLHENVEGIVPVVYQSTTVQKPSPLYHSVNHPQHAKGVAAQSDVFPQSRHRLIEDYYYHCYLLVDLFDCRVHETVIRHLPIYGQAISRSRFLVQREQFHFLLPRSQRCSLPRRMRSRVTHGTCPVLQFIKRLGFRLWQKKESWYIASRR